MRKITLLLVLAGIVAFIFSGCTPVTPTEPKIIYVDKPVMVGGRMQGSGERVERIVISPILRDKNTGALYVKWNPEIGPDKEYEKPGARYEKIIEDFATIKTQNTYVVTAVRWDPNITNPQTNTKGYWEKVQGIKIKWILNTFEDEGLYRRVGDIVDWDHSGNTAGSMDGWQDYLYNTVSTLTNYEKETIKVQVPKTYEGWNKRPSDGKPVPTMKGQYEDFIIEPGQTWITITATRPGQTDITAYAPEILHHLGIEGTKYDKVFTTKQWLPPEFGLFVDIVDTDHDPFYSSTLCGRTVAEEEWMRFQPPCNDATKGKAIRYIITWSNQSDSRITELEARLVSPRRGDAPDEDMWGVVPENKRWRIIAWQFTMINGVPSTDTNSIEYQKGFFRCHWVPNDKELHQPLALRIPGLEDLGSLDPNRSTVCYVWVIPRNANGNYTTRVVSTFNEWKTHSQYGTPEYMAGKVTETADKICVYKQKEATPEKGKRIITEEPTTVKTTETDVYFTKKVAVGSKDFICYEDKWGKCTKTTGKFFEVGANEGDIVTYEYHVFNSGRETLQNIKIVEDWGPGSLATGISGEEIHVGTLKPGEDKLVKWVVQPRKRGVYDGRAYLKIGKGIKTATETGGFCICEVPQRLNVGVPAALDLLKDAEDPFYVWPNADNDLYFNYIFRNQTGEGYIHYMNWVFTTTIPTQGNKLIGKYVVWHHSPIRFANLPNQRLDITKLVRDGYQADTQWPTAAKIEKSPWPTGLKADGKVMLIKTGGEVTQVAHKFPSAGKEALDKIEAESYASNNGRAFFFYLPKKYAIIGDEWIEIEIWVPVQGGVAEGKYQTRILVNASIVCNNNQEVDSIAGEPTRILPGVGKR